MKRGNICDAPEVRHELGKAVRRRSLGEGPVKAPEANDVDRLSQQNREGTQSKAEATMIWVARAVAAIPVMMLIYALILKFMA